MNDIEVVSIDSSPSHTPSPNRQQQAIDPILVNAALQNVSNLRCPSASHPPSSNNSLFQNWDSSREESK
jgi:hypothetical protein